MATKSQKQLELATLKKQYAILQKKYIAMRDNIDQMESDIEPPQLKKKYEGKYFKYNNGYNAEDRWWLYSHCKVVKAVREYVSNRFETDSYGKCEFAHDMKEYGTTSFQIEISKREYNAALRKFKAKLNNL
jgi:lipoate-protein ligase A